MATISEYMSGKICEQISLALSIMDNAPTGQLKGTKSGKALLRNLGQCYMAEPRWNVALFLRTRWWNVGTLNKRGPGG